MASNVNSDNKMNKAGVQAPSYGGDSRLQKLRRKINAIILNKIINTPLQFRLYRSYWHSKVSFSLSKSDSNKGLDQYLTQKPNYGAGIGHQLSNWNSGLYFANYFKVKFAHSPFSNKKWEGFLGFGEGEVNAFEFKKRSGVKTVKLPWFNPTSQKEIDLIGEIISSYKRNKVLFTLCQDQGYKRQCDTSEILSEKFFNAKDRINDKLIYSANCFNIAIHIRRRMKIESDEVWENRGLGNQYFFNILNQVTELLPKDKKVELYLFSQGTIEDFPEFKSFSNIHYCMEMGPIESFLQMVYADLLISSKSSFSYKPALISKGIQICPKTFWHSFPNFTRYILADNDGNFDKSQLINLLPDFLKRDDNIN